VSEEILDAGTAEFALRSTQTSPLYKASKAEHAKLQRSAADLLEDIWFMPRPKPSENSASRTKRGIARKNTSEDAGTGEGRELRTVSP